MKRPDRSSVERALEPRLDDYDRVNVLRSELLCLREAIERCKSVQRVNDEAAQYWEQLRVEEPDSVSIRTRAFVYREVAAELAKALEGF